MPESPNAEAIAKHARALERLRHTAEAIEDLLDELERGEGGGPGWVERLGPRMIRLRDRIAESIATLE
jgi:hypothetical protein